MYFLNQIGHDSIFSYSFQNSVQTVCSYVVVFFNCPNGIDRSVKIAMCKHRCVETTEACKQTSLTVYSILCEWMINIQEVLITLDIYPENQSYMNMP